MEREPQVGASVTPSSRGSGLAAAGGASVAIVALVALVDIAIETYWSGSPIRWWVAPPAIVFVALSVWLFKPGGVAAKRWGWEGAATWTMGGLLLLLAVTAWLPEGQTNGVRMLLQPTARLQLVLLGAGIAMAVVQLWVTMGTLPGHARLAGRVIVVALGAYAEAALGMGIRESMSVSAVLAGAGRWQGVPAWLRGAWLGTVLVLPLGLLAGIAELVRRRRGLPLAVSAFGLPAASLGIGLGALLSGGAAAGGPGVATGIARAASAPSVNVASSVAAMSPEDRRRVYDSEVAALRSRLVRLQSYLDGFPRSFTDVDALARERSTPESAFEFVRDQIAFEPYPGVMKGARGTLVTRGGNALDRALLLAAVLKHNGVSARIAHARLSAGQGRQVLGWITSAPGATERMLASLKGIAGPSPTTAGQQVLADAVARRAGQAAKTVGDAVKVSQPLLDASLRSAGLSSLAGAERQALESVGDHYWVQAVVDNKTVDFDPAHAGAQVGQHLADATDSLDPEDLPEDVFQHIRFRIVAEFLADTGLGATDVLSQEFKAADLFGKNIRVAVAPQTPGADESTCQAILLVGDRRIDGQPLRLTASQAESGQPRGGPDTGTGGPLGGLSGGVGGGDERPPESPTDGSERAVTLGRLSLEAVSRGPHLAEARYRRVIMDRMDQSKESAKLLGAPADDESVRTLLIQAWDGAVSIGTNHPVFVLQTVLDAMKAQESMDEKARARLYLGEPFGVEDLSPPTLSKELIGYFLSSDVTRHLLSRQSAGGPRWYYERPRLAFFRHGFVVGDWAQPQGAPRFAEGIDLLNAPFRFLGPSGDATRLATASGVADTALEGSLIRGPLFNTLPLFAAASAQGVPTVTIGPGQEALLQDVGVPPAIRHVLEEDLAKGQLLVLPARLVTLSGVHTFGWWSVDRTTGFALGKMELGGAQGLVEVTKMHERVEKWTEIFTKFYSGVMRCYLDALADNLGATTDALKTFKLKEGGGPGETPMPGTDTLAACVITQVCDVIAELIIEASVTPAFAREADAAVEGLKQVIRRWIEEQAVEKVKGELQGGVAAACVARMGAGG